MNQDTKIYHFKMKENKIPERIIKNIEFYQLNEEGSKLINQRFEELSSLDNLAGLSVELYPNEKNPNCYALTWEINVRR